MSAALLDNGSSDVFEETSSTITKPTGDSSQLNVTTMERKVIAMVEVAVETAMTTIDELKKEKEQLESKLRDVEYDLKEARNSKEYQYTKFRLACREIIGQIRNGEAGTAVSIAEGWCPDYTSDED